MAHREVRAAAAALSEFARRSHGFHARNVELAIVRTTDPLTAELVTGGLTIGEDMLVLGATARRYDRDHGLKDGDALAVVRLASDDYVALEVLSDSEAGAGIGTELAAATTKHLTDPQGGTINLPVDGWLEAFDADGVRVGWVPVFTSRT